MKKRKGATGHSRELRVRAEQRARANSGTFAASEATPELDAQRLVHELRVHQIELEMQNEELQRARAEAEEGLTRYSDLYDLAPVGYLSLSRDGRILKANLTGAFLLGMERSRLIGWHLADLVASSCRRTFEAFLVKVFESQTKQICAVEIGPAGSESIRVELTAAATVDGQECRVTVTDITERKLAEQERLELQLQLAQAQKMEAIGTLAGGVAHDFNNILTGILGGLSLLDLDLGEKSEHHAEIQEMVSLVKRGSELTKQLLGFARRGRYVVAPLDVGQVVKKTCAMFGRTRKDIIIQIDVAPGLLAVLMDHAQFEQVLLNLLVNAAQAMPEGGHLRLNAENVQLASEQASPPGALPGRFVRLAVKDTGVGMDEATQARIFEPFFTTKGVGHGTGLGLASAYGIMKSHSGSITVKSELGRGSTFTLLLPATDRSIAVEKAPRAAVHTGTGTILVVDDEEQVLQVHSRLLERLGYQVLTASSGRRAVELACQHQGQISLVILDMIMPDMSGGQTFDALKEAVPGVKVLLSSGYSIDGHAQELLDHGCNGFIQKPFDVTDLSTKLKELI